MKHSSVYIWWKIYTDDDENIK
uniref:Uncharacterized protein n=1 Tax=Anguilla anguilla TaxID=7936 RepID=A0A0E9WGP4_ANGAN